MRAALVVSMKRGVRFGQIAMRVECAADGGQIQQWNRRVVIAGSDEERAGGQMHGAIRWRVRQSAAKQIGGGSVFLPRRVLGRLLFQQLELPRRVLARTRLGLQTLVLVERGKTRAGLAGAHQRGSQ